MAVYTYTPSGGAILGYCSVPTTYYKYYEILFDLGEALYVKEKALKGILERVVIKTYVLHQDDDGTVTLVTYKDTLNGLWFEDELISYSIADQLSKDYLNGQADIAASKPCCVVQ